MTSRSCPHCRAVIADPEWVWVLCPECRDIAGRLGRSWASNPDKPEINLQGFTLPDPIEAAYAEALRAAFMAGTRLASRFPDLSLEPETISAAFRLLDKARQMERASQTNPQA